MPLPSSPVESDDRRKSRRAIYTSNGSTKSTTKRKIVVTSTSVRRCTQWIGAIEGPKLAKSREEYDAAAKRHAESNAHKHSAATMFFDEQSSVRAKVCKLLSSGQRYVLRTCDQSRDDSWPKYDDPQDARRIGECIYRSIISAQAGVRYEAAVQIGGSEKIYILRVVVCGYLVDGALKAFVEPGVGSVSDEQRPLGYQDTFDPSKVANRSETLLLYPRQDQVYQFPSAPIRRIVGFRVCTEDPVSDQPFEDARREEADTDDDASVDVDVDEVDTTSDGGDSCVSVPSTVAMTDGIWKALKRRQAKEE